MALASATLIIACGKTQMQEPAGRFRLEAPDSWAQTKSLLEQPGGYETAINSAVLAAYRKGRLAHTAFFQSGFDSMDFHLENRKEYTVYALVNMGDVRASLPEFEADLPEYCYMLPSYIGPSGSVSDMGFPMSGSITFSGSESATVPVIRLRRLLARVNLHLECQWPGGLIENVRVFNMNSCLRPFGVSAIRSSEDVYTGTPETSWTIEHASSLSLVLYVPENMQGEIEGISESSGRSPDNNAEVSRRQERLSYIETDVSGSGIYSGTMVYRSYIGNNATDNFDIEGNCVYNWNITFTEDMLSREEWKYDGGSLDDLRTLAIRNPIRVCAGETLALRNYTSGNLDPATVGWEIRSGGALAGSILNSGSLQGNSFTVRNDASPGERMRIWISPLYNKNTRLLSGTTVIAGVKTIQWKGLDADGGYHLLPASSVRAPLDYSFWDGSFNLPNKGLHGIEWDYSAAPGAGISSVVEDGGEYTSESIVYSAEKTAVPGKYGITATSSTGESTTALLEVDDTRELAWTDISDSFSSGNANYFYSGHDEVHITLFDNSAILRRPPPLKFPTPSPLSFTARDINGEDSFGGYKLTASNYKNHLAFYSSSASVKMYNVTFTNSSDNRGTLQIAGTGVLPTGDYDFSLSNVSGYPGKHTINGHLHIIPSSGSISVYCLSLLPSGKVDMPAGGTVQFIPYVQEFKYYNGRTNGRVEHVLDPQEVIWEGADNGLFSENKPGLYTVSASLQAPDGTTVRASARVNVYVNSGGIHSGWENAGSINLE